MHCHLSRTSLLLGLSIASAFGAFPADSDWPQLAHDAGRTAHAQNGVAPPYRARWIWCGPNQTLRNHSANPEWPEDLTAKPGTDYPWRDASPAWKHLFALRTADLSEAFTVPNGPADGCGSPAPAPVVDSEGRVLAWFKTAHPTLTAKGSFGTRFSMDISAIDLKSGLRVPIDNGHLSGTTGETDNLFDLSTGGALLYLRQRFRGTKTIDLQRSTSHLVQAPVRSRDGGTWLADVVYRDRGGLPRGSQTPLHGREAVVIAGDKLLFAEEYCVTCVEHVQP